MPSALTHQERHHPAKFSGPVLDELKQLLDDWVPPAGRILDPFAGVGWIHRVATLDRPTFAGELERPWAENHGHAGRTVVADAAAMPWRSNAFAAVATSVVYMNRMRDRHNAREASRRNTYTHRYRELVGDRQATLRPGNTGAMNDSDYAKASHLHLAEMLRVVESQGLLLINVSNSIEDGQEKNTVERWINWLCLRRCSIREVRPVATRRNRQGANGDARVDHEVIVVAQTPEKGPQTTLL